jgi:hypothetical protein
MNSVLELTPKVALCVPSGKDWSAHTAMSLIELSILSTAHGIGIKPICKQCSIISMSRNMHVREALSFEPKATHIMWVDSDMKCPPQALIKLLSDDKDIVAAFYNRRVPPYDTVGHLIGKPDISGGGIHAADVVPGGFTLVRREVYEKIDPPWYYESYDKLAATPGDPDGTIGEDIGFSKKALAAGFELWCDADVTFEVGHVGEMVVPCLRPAPLKEEKKAA